VNIESPTDKHNQIFNQIFFQDPCSFLTSVISLEDCHLVAKKPAAKGMDILLVRYIENLDNVPSIYLIVKAGGTWPFAVALIKPDVDTNPTINKILSFVFTPRGVELSKRNLIENSPDPK